MNLLKFFKFFFFTLAVILISYFCWIFFNYLQQPKTPFEYFQKIAIKKVPKADGHSFLSATGKIKFASEIPQFKNKSSLKKEAWDKLAKEFIEVVNKIDLSINKFMQHPLSISIEKLSEKLQQKIETINKELNKDSEIQKINVQINELENTFHPLRLKLSTIYETKKHPLQIKQGHISWGAPGSFRNYLFGSGLPAGLVNILIPLYKKTRAYKELEKQILEIETQLKPLEKKIKVHKTKFSRLFERQRKRMSALAATSKNIQHLTSEIEALKKELSKARAKSRKLQMKNAKKHRRVEKLDRLSKKLHKLFDEMNSTEHISKP